jgi:type II secretory pathway component PulF
MNLSNLIDMEAFREWNARRSFGGKVKARVYNKLASLLDAGVSLTKALDILIMHATHDGKKPNTPSAIVLRAWAKKINNGKPLGRAVQGWIPDSDRIVIEAGERAGTLSSALRNALFIEESMKKIRKTILGGLSYPLLLIAVAIGLLLMFSLYILPGYEDIQPRDKWEGMAKSMLELGDAINFWTIPLLIFAGSIVGGIIWSMPRWIGPTRKRFDNYPPWTIYRLINGSGFMLSVAALVKAGVQIPEILRILKRDASPWYVERIDAAKRYVDNGLSLGEALYRSGYGFPEPEAVIDLRVFAELEGFDEKLEYMGRQWVEESVEKVNMQMAVFKQLAMVLFGLVFATIAIGTISINLQIMNAGQRMG